MNRKNTKEDIIVIEEEVMATKIDKGKIKTMVTHPKKLKSMMEMKIKGKYKFSN